MVRYTEEKICDFGLWNTGYGWHPETLGQWVELPVYVNVKADEFATSYGVVWR